MEEPKKGEVKETSVPKMPGLNLLRNYFGIKSSTKTKSGIVLPIGSGDKAYNLPIHLEVAVAAPQAKQNYGIEPGVFVTMKGTARPYMQFPYQGEDHIIYDANDVIAVWSAEQVEAENDAVKAKVEADKAQEELARKISLGLGDAAPKSDEGTKIIESL